LLIPSLKRDRFLLAPPRPTFPALNLLSTPNHLGEREAYFGYGEIISSGESYKNKQDAIHAVHLVMDTNRQTPFVEL